MTTKKTTRRAVTAEIELDRKRTLRLDLNALADIEEDTGLSLMTAAGQRAFEDMSVAQLRAVLWALLRDEDPELTVRDVGKLVGLSDLEDVASKIGELFVQAMPEGEKVPLAKAAGSGKAPTKDA